MNVFLDTNVYLSFYHLSSDDLEELKKLAVLAREGGIRLHLPAHIEDEFRRNREDRIADSLHRLAEQTTSLQSPQLARQYDDFDKLIKSHRTFTRILKGLIAEIRDDALTRQLEADSVVEELFNAGDYIPLTREDVTTAKLRVESGNPPGKKGSIGDALIWQALLRHVRKGSDLYLISEDGDFYSPLDRSYIHEFLRHEWEEINGSQIHPYRKISSFFAEHFPQIELATELEKDLLIRQLAESSSFSESHGAIGKLSQFSDFTREQLNAIVTAAVTNSQIYYIARDFSIHSFLSRVVDGREDMIDEENRSKIRYVIDEIEEYGEVPN